MYDLNLLPPKMRKKRSKPIKFDNPTYGLFLLLMVITAVFLINHQLDTKLKDADVRIKKVMSDINTVTPQFAQFNAPKTEDASYVELKAKLEKINQLLGKGLPWALVLDEISVITPAEVTVESITEVNPGIIQINAKTTTLTFMAQMKEAMDKNNKFSQTQLMSYEFTPSTIIERPSMGVKFTIMTQYKINPDNSNAQGQTTTNPNGNVPANTQPNGTQQTGNKTTGGGNGASN